MFLTMAMSTELRMGKLTAIVASIPQASIEQITLVDARSLATGIEHLCVAFGYGYSCNAYTIAVQTYAAEHLDSVFCSLIRKQIRS